MQSLEFAAEPGQSVNAVLQLRNAGSIILDVSLEPQHHANLFTVTPQQCEIEPGGISEVSVHFHAPDNPSEYTGNGQVVSSDVPGLRLCRIKLS